MEEEFIQNQERLKPTEEKAQVCVYGMYSINALVLPIILSLGSNMNIYSIFL